MDKDMKRCVKEFMKKYHEKRWDEFIKVIPPSPPSPDFWDELLNPYFTSRVDQ